MFKSERRKIVTLSRIINYYKGLLEKNKQDHQAYHQIGIAHRLLKQNQLAIKHLKLAIIYAPNNLDYLEELGMTYFREREYSEAIKQFTAYLTLDRTNRNILHLLASCYKSLGDIEQAKSLYDHLFETNSQDYLVALELAEYYRKKQEYRKCLFYFELIAKLKPDNEFNRVLGNLYQKTGQEEKAIEAYTQVIKHDPEEWKIWYTLGLLYLQKEDYSTARTCFMELVRNDVANANIYYDLAVVCAKMNDPRTLEFIQEAIALNKEFIQKFKEDSTFSNIRRTKEYKELLQLIDKRNELLNRIVYVDGSNVAHYANGKSPSIENITNIVERLEEIGFEKIFVITGAGLWHYIDDKELFEILLEKRLIIQAPAKTDDDLLIIKTAIEKQGLIVSNDSFNDYQFDLTTSKYLKENQIRYSIIDNVIQLVMAKNHYLN